MAKKINKEELAEEVVSTEVVDVPVEEVEVESESLVSEIPEETAFIDTVADETAAETAEIADVSATEAVVAETKKPAKIIHLKGETKYGKTLVFFSFFGLMLGAIIVALNAILGLLNVQVGSTLTGISQLITYAVVAVVGLRFVHNKKIGWLIAYIVALVVILAFIALPIVMDIVDKLPAKEEQAQKIVSLVNMFISK